MLRPAQRPQEAEALESVKVICLFGVYICVAQCPWVVRDVQSSVESNCDIADIPGERVYYE
jgi:hypothetical protein